MDLLLIGSQIGIIRGQILLMLFGGSGTEIDSVDVVEVCSLLVESGQICQRIATKCRRPVHEQERAMRTNLASVQLVQQFPGDLTLREESG